MKDKLIDHVWKHALPKPQDTVELVNAETERVKDFLRGYVTNLLAAIFTP